MSRWPVIKLGDVLRLDLIKEVIDPSKSYEMLGVLSFGKGLFKRDTIESGNRGLKSSGTEMYAKENHWRDSPKTLPETVS